MGIKFANNAVSTLASSITGADSSFSVATGEGARFPTLGAGEFCIVTIQNGAAMEIVRVTARAGDVFTVTRAQESTLAQNFAAGSSVTARVTAGSMAQVITEATAAAAAAQADADAAATAAADAQADADAAATAAAARVLRIGDTFSGNVGVQSSNPTLTLNDTATTVPGAALVDIKGKDTAFVAARVPANAAGFDIRMGADTQAGGVVETSGGPLRFAAGNNIIDAGAATLLAASYGFSESDDDTSIRSGGEDILEIVVNGALRMSFAVSGTTIHTGDLTLTTGKLRGGSADAGYLKSRGSNDSISFGWLTATPNRLFANINDADDKILPWSANIVEFNAINYTGGNRALAWRQTDDAVWVVINDGTSDERFKTNIESSSVDALARLNALDIVQFDWASGAPNKGHVDLGVLAQQIRDRVHPSLVVGDNPLVPDFKGLVPWLIRAVQQLSARVEELESRGGSGVP